MIIKAERRSADEQFAVALRHHRAGRLTEAERLYREICTLDPTHVGSLHLLGVLSHQLGRRDAADLIRRAVTLKPEFAEAHNDLGVVFMAHGDIGDARSCFERALTLKPDYAAAHGNLGNALGRLGRLDEAMVHFQRALALDRQNPMMHLYLGNALNAQGRIEAAAAQYERALAIDPNLAIAHYNLGAAVKQLGRLEPAVEHYRRAVALMPNFAEAHNNLGNALREVGRLEEAVTCCERALALKPQFAGAHNNLGNALKELHRLDEAVAHYEQALAIDPSLAMSHYNLGVARRAQSRIAEARACFERALAIEPNHVEARFARCMAQLPILYTSEAEIGQQRAGYQASLAALRDTVEQATNPGDLAAAVGSHQPFYLAYQGRNDRDLQAIYGSLVCRIMAGRFPPAALAQPPTRDEPVRVGIVSGFFRRHSNWKVPVKGWLTQLDRQKFRIFGYHTGVHDDAETKAAAALCERFVQGPLSLERWRRAILDDAPHVLVYPEIGMDPMCAQLAAQRLAPVQCNSWGHPDTSGFPTLDYYLSSDLMEPRDAEQHYTERLVRLPNLSIYYESGEPEPIPIERAELGLRPAATVYWCSQSLFKYLPQFDAVFPRIARAVGNCQFTFIEFPGAAHVTELFRTRLEQAFAAFGLRAAEHCAFLPRLDQQRFLGAMGQCDILLDSIGWSGCNSTLESLAHDLPIVTMRGPLMRGRHSAATLRRMGIVDTIAETVDEYVSIAVRLAKDLPLRAALKARIAASKAAVYRDNACIAALEEFLDREGRRTGCDSPGR